MEYMVLDTELDKVVFEGSYYECSRYITVTAMNDIFVGNANMSKYQIINKE